MKSVVTGKGLAEGCDGNENGGEGFGSDLWYRINFKQILPLTDEEEQVFRRGFGKVSQLFSSSLSFLGLSALADLFEDF